MYPGAEADESDPFRSARGERRREYEQPLVQQDHNAGPAGYPSMSPAGYGPDGSAVEAYPVGGDASAAVVDNSAYPGGYPTAPTVPAAAVQEDDSRPGDEAPQRLVTHDDPVYNNKYARIYIFVLAVIFIASGMALAILGRIELDHKVLPICPDCENFAVALYIAGSSVAVLGLIGLASAITRLKPVAFVFSFLLGVLCLFTFACGVAVVIFELGLKESEVERVWVDSVGNERQVICDLQKTLQCSGFTECCGLYNTSLPIVPANTVCNLTTVEWVRQCDPQCVVTNQQYVEGCHNKLEDLIKSHFHPIIGVAFTLAVLLFVGTILAVRMTLYGSRARRTVAP